MNPWGWCMMALSWAAILSLVIGCVRKILSVDRDNIHAPLDIDTDPHPETKRPPRDSAEAFSRKTD